MTNLSPAAQAVLDAFLGDAENTGLQMDDMRENVAAALRAAADFLAYETQVDDPMMTTVRVVDVDDLLIIANELEQQL